MSVVSLIRLMQTTDKVGVSLAFEQSSLRARIRATTAGDNGAQPKSPLEVSDPARVSYVFVDSMFLPRYKRAE